MSGDSTGSVFRKDYGWQKRAVDALMTGISDFYNTQPGQFRHAFIVEVSPSGGKTKFSLKAAKAMIDASLIDKVIWVVPRETIKNGFKDDAEDTGLKIDVRLDTIAASSIQAVNRSSD
jgi:KaiC/GvpD/RAD55 family RecA-like ATPase